MDLDFLGLRRSLWLTLCCVITMITLIHHLEQSLYGKHSHLDMDQVYINVHTRSNKQLPYHKSPIRSTETIKKFGCTLKDIKLVWANLLLRFP